MEKISQIARAEEDIKYATRVMKLLLTTVGAWPISYNSPLLLKIVQKLKHVFTYFVFFIMVVPTSLYVIKKETDNKNRMKLLGPIVSTGLQMVKYTVILFRMTEVQKGLDAIKQDWINATEENRLIFLEKARIGRRIVILVAMTIYSGGFGLRVVLPLLKGPIVLPNNVTIRRLPCPVYISFLNSHQTPIYEILFLLEVIAGFASYAVISGSCGISALLVLHACSMQRILNNKMKLLLDKRHMTETEMRSKIADIVEYQIKGKEFLDSAQKVVGYICLAEVLGCTFLICEVEYCVILEFQKPDTSSVTMCVTLSICFTFCFSVFVLCYIGQLLLDENEDVSHTSCTTDWYRMQPKQARSLVLIIAMSNYPMKLTGAKMVVMSLTTFTDVLKLSLGYMNMLRQLI